MTRSSFLLPLALLLAGTSAHADVVPRSTKRIDAYLDGLQGQVNGSIAISERGVVRYKRSLGFATLQNGVANPADAGTRYRIGAVTRLFTAALTLQLAERATLTLDNKLAEFYPDLPNALEVSYRNVLQQRSGLSNYTAAKDFDSWRTTPRTRDEMLKVIIDAGPIFPPGDRIEVNDTNYLVLGYVLEKIHERSYDDILRREIANKLGLVRTYFAGTGGTTTLEAISYSWTPEGWRAETENDPTVDGAANGLVSNATDLVAFMDALFSGKVVTPYNLGAMRGDEDARPIALRPVEISGHTGFGESGRSAAFEAAVYHFPDEKISVAWTGNGSKVPIDQILGDVLKLIPKAKAK